MPLHLPLESAALKPAKPVWTPQMTWLRALMASTVLPAKAGLAAKLPRVATARAASFRDFRVMVKVSSWNNRGYHPGWAAESSECSGMLSALCSGFTLAR